VQRVPRLAEPVLQALAKEFFNAELDVETNRLRSLNIDGHSVAAIRSEQRDLPAESRPQGATLHQSVTADDTVAAAGQAAGLGIVYDHPSAERV